MYDSSNYNYDADPQAEHNYDNSGAPPGFDTDNNVDFFLSGDAYSSSAPYDQPSHVQTPTQSQSQSQSQSQPDPYGYGYLAPPPNQQFIPSAIRPPPAHPPYLDPPPQSSSSTPSTNILSPVDDFEAADYTDPVFAYRLCEFATYRPDIMTRIHRSSGSDSDFVTLGRQICRLEDSPSSVDAGCLLMAKRVYHHVQQTFVKWWRTWSVKGPPVRQRDLPMHIAQLQSCANAKPADAKEMPWKGAAIASMGGTPEYWGYDSRSRDDEVRWTGSCPVSPEEARLTHLSSNAAGKAREDSAADHHDGEPWGGAPHQAAPSGANIPAHLSSKAAGKLRQDLASDHHTDELWQGTPYQAAPSDTNVPGPRRLADGSAHLPVESNVPVHPHSSLSVHSHGSSLPSLSNPDPSRQLVSTQNRTHPHVTHAPSLTHTRSLPSTSVTSHGSSSVPSLASGVGNIIHRSHSTQEIQSAEALQTSTQSFHRIRTQAYQSTEVVQSMPPTQAMQPFQPIQSAPPAPSAPPLPQLIQSQPAPPLAQPAPLPAQPGPPPAQPIQPGPPPTQPIQPGAMPALPYPHFLPAGSVEGGPIGSLAFLTGESRASRNQGAITDQAHARNVNISFDYVAWMVAANPSPHVQPAPVHVQPAPVHVQPVPEPAPAHLGGFNDPSLPAYHLDHSPPANDPSRPPTRRSAMITPPGSSSSSAYQSRESFGSSTQVQHMSFHQGSSGGSLRSMHDSGYGDDEYLHRVEGGESGTQQNHQELDDPMQSE